ncbi:hypothetical protein H4CHR_04217 [Variovorax sp. PBS-H4]|nr:hypothetical protein H4CHR_04217 [Variovorax sp. PBS-H4]
MVVLWAVCCTFIVGSTAQLPCRCDRTGKKTRAVHEVHAVPTASCGAMTSYHPGLSRAASCKRRKSWMRPRSAMRRSYSATAANERLFPRRRTM